MCMTSLSNGCNLVDQILCVRDIFPECFVEELTKELEEVRDDRYSRYYELSSVIRYNRRPEYDVKEVKNIPIGEERMISGLNILRVSENLCVA